LHSRIWLLFNSPGLWLLLVHRISHWWVCRWTGPSRGSLYLRLIAVPLSGLEWLVKVATKSDILGRSDIEGGVCVPDQGCLIFGATKMGTGTVIGARTTIGMSLADRGLPEIGRNVWIGSDCVVYGALTIGDGATLLPGTALTRSIPAGVVMHGNPARLAIRDFDNTALRTQSGLDAEAYVSAMRNN
jgi:serine acetyltransferase